MKRTISLILIILTLFSVVSCSANKGTVSVSEEGNVIKITVDEFRGKEKIKINHEEIGDGTMFCSVMVTEGSLQAFTRESGLFASDQEYFDVDAGDGRENEGVYVFEGISFITLTLIADEPTSGIVYICFEREVVNYLPFD